MTVLDVIVFNQRTSDVYEWALALAHVDQLVRLGTRGLASQYLTASAAIRDDAEHIADECAIVVLHG